MDTQSYNTLCGHCAGLGPTPLPEAYPPFRDLALREGGGISVRDPLQITGRGDYGTLLRSKRVGGMTHRPGISLRVPSEKGTLSTSDSTGPVGLKSKSSQEEPGDVWRPLNPCMGSISGGPHR
jgi:hypothetical protein